MGFDRPTVSLGESPTSWLISQYSQYMYSHTAGTASRDPKAPADLRRVQSLSQQLSFRTRDRSP